MCCHPQSPGDDRLRLQLHLPAALCFCRKQTKLTLKSKSKWAVCMQPADSSCCYLEHGLKVLNGPEHQKVPETWRKLTTGNSNLAGPEESGPGCPRSCGRKRNNMLSNWRIWEANTSMGETLRETSGTRKMVRWGRTPAAFSEDLGSYHACVSLQL